MKTFMSNRRVTACLQVAITALASSAAISAAQGRGVKGSEVALVTETNFCLEADFAGSSRIGQRVQTASCHGQDAQRWLVTGTLVRNAATGGCLEVYEPDQFRDGGRVQLSPCTGSPSQQWRYFGSQIRSGATGKCLHARDPYKPGAGVEVWDCNGSVGQAWTIR